MRECPATRYTDGKGWRLLVIRIWACFGSAQTHANCPALCHARKKQREGERETPSPNEKQQLPTLVICTQMHCARTAQTTPDHTAGVANRGHRRGWKRDTSQRGACVSACKAGCKGKASPHGLGITRATYLDDHAFCSAPASTKTQTRRAEQR